MLAINIFFFVGIIIHIHPEYNERPVLSCSSAFSLMQTLEEAVFDRNFYCRKTVRLGT